MSPKSAKSKVQNVTPSTAPESDFTALDITEVNDEVLAALRKKIKDLEKAITKLGKSTKKNVKQEKSQQQPQVNLDAQADALIFFDVDDTLSPTTAIIQEIYENPDSADQYDNNQNLEVLNQIDHEAAKIVEDCCYRRDRADSNIDDSITVGKEPRESMRSDNYDTTLEQTESDQQVSAEYQLNKPKQQSQSQLADWLSQLLNEQLQSNNNIINSIQPILVTAAGIDAFTCVINSMPKLKKVLLSNNIKIYVNHTAETDAEKQTYKEVVFKKVVLERLKDSNSTLRLCSIGDSVMEMRAMCNVTVGLKNLLNNASKSTIIIKFRDEEDFVSQPHKILRQLKDLRVFNNGSSDSSGFYQGVAEGGEEVEGCVKLWQAEYDSNENND